MSAIAVGVPPIFGMPCRRFGQGREHDVCGAIRIGAESGARALAWEEEDRILIMPQVKSLAEHLGVRAPNDDASGMTRLEDIGDPHEFAKAVLSSYEFRRYIVNTLILGEIPAAVLLRVMDLAGWQKPPDRIEITDKTVADVLTPEQLEARSERLAEMARFLRRAEQFDEPLTSDSVH